MKKTWANALSLLLVVVLCVAMLCGCGNDPTASSAAPAATTDSAAPSGTTTDGTETGAPSTNQPADGSLPLVSGDTYDMYYMNTDRTALQESVFMGNGTNLGNTFEATNTMKHKAGSLISASKAETLWNSTVTTKEVIAGIKAAGFTTIRIPVAWTNAMAYDDDDYTIQTEYLDRIEEVVKWALEEEMYVIINDHWDGGWYGMFGARKKVTNDDGTKSFVVDEDARAKAWVIYEEMWKQVAERFNAYGDHLIFEGANEELCTRLNDKYNGVEGNLTDSECYETTNKINQKFVDIVRATGGNNAYRYLLIPGYGTDITNTCKDAYKMPTDTVEGRLFISVHYYTPNGFCLSTAYETWGTVKEITAMNTYMEMMTKFTEQGYGVIIGEYGIEKNEKHEVKVDTVKFIEQLLDNCTKYNYVPCLWDCSSFYIRSQCQVVNADVAKVYSENSISADIASGKTYNELVAAAETRMADKMKTAEDEMAAQIAESGISADSSVAWIMYTSTDWQSQTCPGDTFDLASKSNNIDWGYQVVNGAGEYNVFINFSSGSGKGIEFMALGISNAEDTYANYSIKIKEFKINGEPVEMTALGYTTSDDGLCTRMNLYNHWVSVGNGYPGGARSSEGTDLAALGCDSMILDAAAYSQITSIEITFEYIAP